MRKYQIYMEKYNSRMIMMGLFVFLFHGSKLFSNQIGIDTEDVIHLQGDFYNGWLSTGRQGLVFLKALLGSLWYNPYFAGLLTLVFLAAAGAAFFLLWENAKGGEERAKGDFRAWFFGGLLLFSHPILTEQLYFSLQSMEISMGFLLTAAALYLTELGIDRGKGFLFGVSGLILLVTLSAYQVFAPLYIFGTVTLLLIRTLRREEQDSGLLRRMSVHGAVFLAAFLVNTVITRLFFSGSDYLRAQILWGKTNIADNLRAVGGHLVKALTGYDSPYYTAGYGLLWIVTGVLLFLTMGRKKENRRKGLLLFFFTVSLFAAPFLMTILCGGAPVVRSQLVLPFASAFLGWLLVQLGKELPRGRNTLWWVITAVCLFTGAGQLQSTMRLYYTDRLRYEQDAALGRALIDRIDQVRGNDWLPVIVIGTKEFQGNYACVEGETIGKSFFAYDAQTPPAFHYSTRRILGFLHTLGKSYQQAPAERIPEAMEFSTYMPEWPAENSVQICDGMIVVKLSHYE